MAILGKHSLGKHQVSKTSDVSSSSSPASISNSSNDTPSHAATHHSISGDAGTPTNFLTHLHTKLAPPAAKLNHNGHALPCPSGSQAAHHHEPFYANPRPQNNIPHKASPKSRPARLVPPRPLTALPPGRSYHLQSPQLRSLPLPHPLPLSPALGPAPRRSRALAYSESWAVVYRPKRKGSERG